MNYIQLQLEATRVSTDISKNGTILILARREGNNHQICGSLLCMRSKYQTSSPAVLLQPLPIPKASWEEISIDLQGSQIQKDLR